MNFIMAKISNLYPIEGHQYRKASLSIEVAPGVIVPNFTFMHGAKGYWLAKPQTSYMKNGEKIYKDAVLLTKDAHAELTQLAKDKYFEVVQSQGGTPSVDQGSSDPVDSEW